MFERFCSVDGKTEVIVQRAGLLINSSDFFGAKMAPIIGTVSRVAVSNHHQSIAVVIDEIRSFKLVFLKYEETCWIEEATLPLKSGVARIEWRETEQAGYPPLALEIEYFNGVLDLCEPGKTGWVRKQAANV